MSEQFKQSVCLNGHQVSARLKLDEAVSGFCEKCGEPLITNCPNCDFPIYGDKDIDGIIAIGFEALVPKYCQHCGKAYPWTQSEIDSAIALVKLSDLSDKDKKDLSDSIPDLTVDGPKTKLAATKFKLYISKAGKVVAESLREFAVDVASDAAKKTIGL